MNRWNETDIQYLRDNYSVVSNYVLSIKLNRTESSIQAKACVLSITEPCNYWLKDDIDYLKKNYPLTENSEIAKYLNRSESSVSHKAQKLNIIKDIAFRSMNTVSRNKSRSIFDYDSVYDIAKSCKTSKEFQMKNIGAYSWAVKNNCIGEVSSHMISQNYSTPQLITKYIFDVLTESTCLYNDRSIIKPYEIDIYYTEYKLAIEYNGTYWHSNEINNNSNDNTELKVELCSELGIELIVIEERGRKYECDIKSDIIDNLPIINRILNKNINRRDVLNIVIDTSIFDDLLNEESIFKITEEYYKFSEFIKKENSLYKKLYRLNQLKKYTSHMFKRRYNN